VAFRRHSDVHERDRSRQHYICRGAPEDSKSVISKRISDLEAALRVELFRRSTASVKPTELARSLYDRVVPLVQRITEATKAVSDRTESLRGRLRIITPVSFGINFLGPVIAEFAKRHPELEIAVDYS
jgi:DNA-binding transcriptional LysR family regulator